MLIKNDYVRRLMYSQHCGDEGGCSNNNSSLISENKETLQRDSFRIASELLENLENIFLRYL